MPSQKPMHSYSVFPVKYVNEAELETMSCE